LTLEVPPGLQRIEGDEVQIVPPLSLGAHSSIVSWKVKVLQTGTFPLKVLSSTGLSQMKTISITRPEGQPPPRLTVDLSGSFEPGQEFMVGARLASTGPGPQLPPVLTLPQGLSQGAGPIVKSQASADGKGSVNVAVWKVKVLQPGKHPVRVEWNGAAITKTLSIVKPEVTTGGYVTMTLKQPLAPGKAFTVIGTVINPLPGQTLTLQLPPGLRLAGKEGEQAVPVERVKDRATVIDWQVMVDQPGTYPMRLVSSTGVTLKKTIIIEQNHEKGGDFRLGHEGDIAPGQEFTVRADVTTPVAGQKLTLMPLPPGLRLVDGPAVQVVPPPTDGKHEGHSVVTWRVSVVDKGTLHVRVASTTGVIQSFTITIAAEQPVGSGPQLFGGKH